MLRTSDVLKTMQGLAPGQRAVWQLSPTFGSSFTVVTLDPQKNPQDERRYTLHLGGSLEKALAAKAFMAGRRSKKISSWIGDRNPTLIEGPAALRKAA